MVQNEKKYPITREELNLIQKLISHFVNEVNLYSDRILEDVERLDEKFDLYIKAMPILEKDRLLETEAINSKQINNISNKIISLPEKIMNIFDSIEKIKEFNNRMENR